MNSLKDRRLLLACIACATVLTGAAARAQSPAWSTLQPTGLTYGLFRGGSSAVYDPVSNELIVYSGYSQDQSLGFTHLNDTWILTNANGLNRNGTWTQLIPNNAPGNPPGTHNHSAVYDSVNNRMIVYGGCQGGCLPVSGDVWVLTNANGQGGTPAWVQLSPTGGPPPVRQAHQAVYDPNTNSMIIWGGQNGGGSCGGYNDVWVLSNANGLGGTPNWTQLSPAGGPPLGDFFSNAVYDPTSNVMTVFGGAIQGNGCNGLQTNAVWTLSNANGQGGTPVWTNLIPQGARGAPASRETAAAAYNPNTNAMTVFGGSTHSTQNMSDTWVLSNANGIGGTPVWTKLNPSAADPGHGNYRPEGSYRWNGSAMDATNNRFIMWGGDTPDGPIWGAWVLSPAN